MIWMAHPIQYYFNSWMYLLYCKHAGGEWSNAGEIWLHRTTQNVFGLPGSRCPERHCTIGRSDFKPPKQRSFSIASICFFYSIFDYVFECFPRNQICRVTTSSNISSSALVYCEHSGCDEGWLPFHDNCYFFNHDQTGGADWNNAKQVCQFLGGHLVDIRDATEKTFVGSHLRTSNSISNQYIIGMTEPEEGHWKYLNGDEVTFLPWAPGEPNNYSGPENCGTVFAMNGRVGKLNDERCTAKRGKFICKKNATQ